MRALDSLHLVRSQIQPNNTKRVLQSLRRKGNLEEEQAGLCHSKEGTIGRRRSRSCFVFLYFYYSKQIKTKAVIKRRGLGIFPSYYELFPRLLSKENERKIEPKEIPSCLIPRLLVVFTRQLEILVTTLQNHGS